MSHVALAKVATSHVIGWETSLVWQKGHHRGMSSHPRLGGVSDRMEDTNRMSSHAQGCLPESPLALRVDEFD